MKLPAREALVAVAAVVGGLLLVALLGLSELGSTARAVATLASMLGLCPFVFGFVFQLLLPRREVPAAAAAVCALAFLLPSLMRGVRLPYSYDQSLLLSYVGAFLIVLVFALLGTESARAVQGRRAARRRPRSAA